MKKLFGFVLVTVLTLGAVSNCWAQENEKYQWRLGFGPDMFWKSDMSTGEGGLVINFAIGDARGVVQPLFTFNSSLTGLLLSAGYQNDVAIWIFRVSPGIMINRWREEVRVPSDIPSEDIFSEEIATSVHIEDDGPYKVIKWRDITVVPYLGFGVAPLDTENIGIYFTYKVGPIIWSHNPYSIHRKSPFLHYASWLFGFYKKF